MHTNLIDGSRRVLFCLTEMITSLDNTWLHSKKVCWLDMEGHRTVLRSLP